MEKWKEIKEITTEDEPKKTEKKTKKYTGQFAPLLKIHIDRLAQAKELNDSAKILTAEYEIDRINELIARENKGKCYGCSMEINNYIPITSTEV